MARTPRASVSKTSGQGISRLSYQKGYAMKRGDAPRVKSDGGDSGDKRNYAKKGSSPKYGDTSINVSYGDTYFPTDLKDIEAIGERQVPKTSVGSKSQGPKKWRKK